MRLSQSREKEEPLEMREYVKRLLSYALFGAIFLSVVQIRCQSQSTTVSADRATQEVNALLSKSLAKSRKQKVWPDDPLRGFQVFAFNPSVSPGFLSEETFKKLKAWNINVLRLWIDVDPDSPSAVKPGETQLHAPLNNPIAPYKKNLEGLRIALALAEKYHIYIIPVAGGVVGRETDALSRETNPGNCYPGLIALWEYIAKNFGTHPWLLGYDLLNEPNSKDEVDYWHSTMVPQLIKRVRAIDRNTYLIIETAPWSLPDQAFPPSLTPVKDPKAIYSFHFYYPHSYTHQGLYTYKGAEFEGKPYPGMLRLFESSTPTSWDKAALEATMKNAISFQKKYGVKIFVGEFSVIRWAPGAARWLSDVIDIFEKHHFSWTYHCYGTWNGWNPTFPADAPQSALTDGGVETDRMKLLIKAWAKNKKY